MKIIDGERYYTISEVGELIGKTRATIVRWYEFEENKECKFLPSFIQLGGNHARYFKESDINKFYDFMDNREKGDMSTISTKYNGYVSKK